MAAGRRIKPSGYVQALSPVEPYRRDFGSDVVDRRPANCNRKTSDPHPPSKRLGKLGLLSSIPGRRGTVKIEGHLRIVLSARFS
jgi:hypothetical protein